MRVYVYHSETKELLGVDEADESPLEPGVFILPANTTAVAPPEFREGFVRVFNGEKWVYAQMPVTDEGSNETERPTEEDMLRQLTDAIRRHMDTKARERNYDGILSLCTYATSTNPKFAAEGQAGVAWRDACWAKGYEIMAEVQAGTREIPTVERLLSEMPEFSWPAVAE